MNYFTLKAGMKMPGGTVYEVEHRISEDDMNLALDGHVMIYRAMRDLVEQFMDGLPREKDAK